MIIGNLMTYGLRMRVNRAVLQSVLPLPLSRDDIFTLLAIPGSCVLFAVGALLIEWVGLRLLLAQEKVGLCGSCTVCFGPSVFVHVLCTVGSVTGSSVLYAVGALPIEWLGLRLLLAQAKFEHWMLWFLLLSMSGVFLRLLLHRNAWQSVGLNSGKGLTAVHELCVHAVCSGKCRKLSPDC